MSKTIKHQRNWQFFQFFKKANAGFKINRADPILAGRAVDIMQEDIRNMMKAANFTTDEERKVSYREGYRRDSKAKLKVRNRRIEKRSLRQKAMLEVRNIDFDLGDD